VAKPSLAKQLLEKVLVALRAQTQLRTLITLPEMQADKRLMTKTRATLATIPPLGKFTFWMNFYLAAAQNDVIVRALTSDFLAASDL
jgi:hypothetical protein